MHEVACDGLQEPQFSIVIPVYNEANIIESSIRRLCSAIESFTTAYEVIVAENGSKDRTAEIARSLSEELPRVRLLQTGEPNYGKALRAGILASRGRYIHCDEIDICDADFHRRALSMFVGVDGGFDLVVGSKASRGARDERPLARRVATKVLNLLLRLSLGFKGTDTHGLKALRRESVMPIVEKCIADRDIFASELVIRAERAKKRIVEIPLTISELRKPPIGLGRRVPKVIKTIAQLMYVIRLRRQ